MSSDNNENPVNFHSDFVNVDHISIFNSSCQVDAKLLEDLPQLSFSKGLQNDTGRDAQESFVSYDVISPSIELIKADAEDPISSISEIPDNKNTKDLQLNDKSIDYSSTNDSSSINEAKFPFQSLNSTVVEQPNVYPSCCFICGHIFKSSQDHLTYDKSQNFLETNISFLQLLSDIVNQNVVTDSDSVDLCIECSDLMNDVDVSTKHLNELKNNINQRFSVNTRPKITFCLFSKSTLNSLPSLMEKNKTELSLTELAISRSRRGRKVKKRPIQNENINVNVTKDDEKRKEVRKSSGRPRKPFQCHKCRLKFMSKISVEHHVKKFHNFDGQSNLKFKEVAKSLSKGKDNISGDPSLSKCAQNISTNLVCKKITNYGVHSLGDGLLRTSNLRKGRKFSFLNTRNIQPKPETTFETTVDGSVMLYMNPVEADSSPSMIKISPEYFNLAKLVKCDICQKKFSTTKSFKIHQISTHGQCKDNYSTSNDPLENPKNLLTSERNPICEFREWKNSISKLKYINQNNSLLIHDSLKSNEFVGHTCGKQVCTKTSLESHLTQQSFKEFLCDECGFLGTNKSSLDDHIRVHTSTLGDKIECKVCGKLIVSSSYKSHMLRMHREMKHICSICGKKFPSRVKLKNHVDTLHSDSYLRQCSICDEKFDSTQILKAHMSKVHSKNFHLCNFCGKEFKLKKDLCAHISRVHHINVKKINRNQSDSFSVSFNSRSKSETHTKRSPSNLKSFHQTSVPNEKPVSSDTITVSLSDENSLMGISHDLAVTTVTVSAIEEPHVELPLLEEYASFDMPTLTSLEGHLPLQSEVLVENDLPSCALPPHSRSILASFDEGVSEVTSFQPLETALIIPVDENKS